MDINTFPQFLSHFTTGTMTPAVTVPLALMIIWSFVWKGAALWKAARNNQMYWFIIMLVVNTLGLLEIIYIYFFSENKKTTSGSVDLTVNK